jgi:hypothetical protein
VEYYPVVRLSLKTDDLTIEITPQEDQEILSFCKETIDTFEVIRGDEPCPSAQLVYCAEPELGQACIQAIEQTDYDVWLTWEGEDRNTPQIFLGDKASSQTSWPAGVRYP